MSKELDLTAYCGLYCEDCIRFESKASELAQSLLEEFSNSEFAEYARIKGSSAKQLDGVDAFSRFDECREVLQAVVDQQCNTPCRIGGGCSAFTCKILQCCRDKNYSGCWECSEFETCEKLDGLNTISGNSHRTNLKMIKEHGFPGWTRHRSKPYIWQQD